MVYTVTFNPAIDYVMHIDNIAAGFTNRSKNEEIYFGGKGINVSCVLAQLGIKSTALGFTAGFTGEALEKEVTKKGINSDFIRLEKGATRINVKLKGDAETEINAAGPDISATDLEKLFAKLETLKDNDILILAGSVPKSVPINIYETILEKLHNKNVRFVVDATGNLLLNVLKYNPFLIKPNRQELEELFAITIEDEDGIISAAQKLKNMGAKNVLVSLGGDGAILLDENGNIYKQPAHKITAINTVGAGDSMIAGFIAGLNKGYEYALKLGSAAGAATAALPDLATNEKIFELLNK